MKKTKVFELFSNCIHAINQGELINRVSKTDKEFHFQNWFENRLRVSGILFDKSGRNAYPDFTLVEFTEGYEIKGLAWQAGNPHTIVTVKYPLVFTMAAIFFTFLADIQNPRTQEMNTRS